MFEYAENKQKELPAPYFILGDFNAEPDSETIRFCDENKKMSVRELAREGGFDMTYHGYRLAEPLYIDYIYADAATADAEHLVGRWDDEKDNVFLSDHYPLFLRISNSFLGVED